MLRWAVWLMCVACAAVDADEDGFPVDEDCNDEDADIRPDAAERFFDDVDQDCDGDVGVAPYVGFWIASEATFNIESAAGEVDLLVGLPLAGGLEVFDDGMVDIDITATDPGGTTEVDIEGTAEEADSDGFELSSPGTVEFLPPIETLALPAVFVDLLCGIDDTTMLCDGTLAVTVDTGDAVLDLTGTTTFEFARTE